MINLGFPGGSNGEESACNERDPVLTPGLGRSHGGGNDNPLQYSCLDNPTDRGAWGARVCGVRKSQTQLSTHTQCFIVYKTLLYHCQTSWQSYEIEQALLTPFHIWGTDSWDLGYLFEAMLTRTGRTLWVLSLVSPARDTRLCVSPRLCHFYYSTLLK